MAYNKNVLQRGFTIVEIMIATLVFSVVITGVMTMVIFIGKQYKQAETRSRLEDTLRDAYQELAVELVTNDTKPNGTTSGSASSYNLLCAGKKKYLYGKYDQASALSSYTSMQSGLWVDSWDGLIGSCSQSSMATATNAVPASVKILKLYVDPASKTLTVVAASATPDLLDFSNPVPENVNCYQTFAGKEYCSVVRLQGTFVRRTE